MANILERYGIKEVADVTFYDIVDKNGIPTMGAPVLYLDTLKVSTIETTAENVSARGGKGNPELITWDYGKEITVTLEDALFSAKSMAIMFGSMNSTTGKVAVGTDASIFRTVPAAQIKDGKVTINNTEITIPYITIGKKTTLFIPTVYDIAVFCMRINPIENIIMKKQDRYNHFS